ncbi:hypothetical protein [methanotrophic endosymbiont of Bathymodiolus puteoserpentis (Logatchev)]|uniref:hypothetical protein n=1 Tax=methanotrophic endosymbiont of Bathymodiolus puteoserpentis (Logatchev) TaxID=343235 RepID=UPI0013CA2DA9|nr:hypothetical protein [methanotrophic endosymbiont of Bathymodiolus puteoserpentis (Logatchev)]SHE21945.1 hypothetical protein BPUTEOMOX_51 [methanotrophic endosymbiont of Bathymodiolus puteoserpentis (Logatchev)]
MNRWHLVSLACGFIPLCVGIFIFLAWLTTRAHWLEVAGIINLYAGLMLFCIGIISLIVYFYKAQKNTVGGYWKNSIVALMILLANIPVAVTIVSTVRYVVSASTVVFENQSSTKVEDIYLSEREHVYEIGSVLPNQTLEKGFHFQSEGAVSYSFTRNGNKYRGIMFGYVTGGMGSSAKMIITKSGKVEINEKV